MIKGHSLRSAYAFNQRRTCKIQSLGPQQQTPSLGPQQQTQRNGQGLKPNLSTSGTSAPAAADHPSPHITIDIVHHPCYSQPTRSFGNHKIASPQWARPRPRPAPPCHTLGEAWVGGRLRWCFGPTDSLLGWPLVAPLDSYENPYLHVPTHWPVHFLL